MFVWVVLQRLTELTASSITCHVSSISALHFPSQLQFSSLAGFSADQCGASEQIQGGCVSRHLLHKTDIKRNLLCRQCSLNRLPDARMYCIRTKMVLQWREKKKELWYLKLGWEWRGSGFIAFPLAEVGGRIGRRSRTRWASGDASGQSDEARRQSGGDDGCHDTLLHCGAGGAARSQDPQLITRLIHSLTRRLCPVYYVHDINAPQATSYTCWLFLFFCSTLFS